VDVSPSDGGMVKVGPRDPAPYYRITFIGCSRACVEAVPAEGYEFANWSGYVTSGENPLCIDFRSSKINLTANFTPAEITHTLTMQVNGSGSVTPAVGTHSYGGGAVVGITAVPGDGWQFESWSGDVADPNSATTTVTMDSSKSVTANFSLMALKLTSEDGMVSLVVDEGTMALSAEGVPLAKVEVLPVEEPLVQPDANRVVGRCFNLLPDGAVFDPPVEVSFRYDPALLPEGVAEEDLAVAYYDEEGSQWVELPSQVNIVTHTITASVSHFTIFAVVTPAESAPSLPSVPEPVPPPGTTSPGANLVFNWALIGGVIGGVVAVGLLVFALVARRRAS